MEYVWACKPCLNTVMKTAVRKPLEYFRARLNALQIPWLIPGLSPVLRFLGISTGAAVMVILNMTMLLQIALVYGHDIDDRARLKEMFAIVLASGLAGSTSVLPQLGALGPTYRALAGGTAVATVSQLIGEAAIRYYRRAAEGSPTAAENA